MKKKIVNRLATITFEGVEDSQSRQGARIRHGEKVPPHFINDTTIPVHSDGVFETLCNYTMMAGVCTVLGGLTFVLIKSVFNLVLLSY